MSAMRRPGEFVAALATAAVLLGASAAVAAPGGSVDFRSAFDASAAPAAQHYTATYRSGDAEHRVEVWRQGATTLRRRTDDAIDLLVRHDPASGELAMTVLDLKRRIRSDVAGASLARIGHPADWFSLAHVLKVPAPGGRVSTPVRGATVETVAPCRWFELFQGEQVSRVCWSRAQGLPLAILDGDGRVVWKVVAVDNRPPATAAFVLDDRGFVRNDTDADIKAD